jgi:hypothetical protein
MSNDDSGDETADTGSTEETEDSPLEDRSLDDLSPEDVQQLSTDELVELSGGGVVDAEGNATAFPDDQGTDEGPSAEETAADLADGLEDISQQSQSTQQEMFTDEWVTTHTDFDSIEAFLEAGPWDVAPEEGIWDVPVDLLDAHTHEHSEYNTWEELSQAAGQEWLDDTLDL